MSAQHSTSHRKHRIEGPKNHYLSFILSIVLTLLAFIAAIYQGLEKPFIVVFILVLAVVQALVQIFFWMHLKEKDHLFPKMGLAFGAFVAASAAIAALYWMWW